MLTKFLVLWLEAPLQSWGVSSKFNYRTTQEFPTKSGIAGLLLNAMDARGEQKELLENFSFCKQTVISYKNKKYDSTPILTDFHMIGSGYNEKDPWESLFTLRTLKDEKGKPTKITYREYLQNSKFAVILETTEELSNIFSNALKEPVHPICLGRSKCFPTDFIYRGVFETFEQAEEQINKIISEKDLEENFRVFDEKMDNEEDVFVLNDVPVCFGISKKYRDRWVTVKKTLNKELIQF